jgi:uncharacterized protein (TIGR02118 family)
MIKASVLYPAGDDATFDIDYYASTHMEIVRRTMNPSKIEIDQGHDGPYVAAGHLYFDDQAALAEAMNNAAEALADIPNFTNVTPVMQTSTVRDHGA